MMTFYAAAGSYQIRNEDGKDMPYIMRQEAPASFYSGVQYLEYVAVGCPDARRAPQEIF